MKKLRTMKTARENRYLKFMIFAFFFSSFSFLLISNASAETVQVSFNIKGCTIDGALEDRCSVKSVGWCDCSSGECKIVQDCKGWDGKLGEGSANDGSECANTCPANNYCTNSGSCTPEVDTSACKDTITNNATCLAITSCYISAYVDNKIKCTSCPPSADKLCSDYTSEQMCNLDTCHFGTEGPDSSMCAVAGIQNCGCKWDINKCIFGFEEIDENGHTMICKINQVLGDCVNDKRTLQTQKMCDGVAKGAAETREIDCGKAVSPLPFFSMFGILGVVSILVLYYIFRK